MERCRGRLGVLGDLRVWVGGCLNPLRYELIQCFRDLIQVMSQMFPVSIDIRFVTRLGMAVLDTVDAGGL